jgi:hypothetical protein
MDDGTDESSRFLRRLGSHEMPEGTDPWTDAF